MRLVLPYYKPHNRTVGLIQKYVDLSYSKPYFGPQLPRVPKIILVINIESGTCTALHSSAQPVPASCSTADARVCRGYWTTTHARTKTHAHHARPIRIRMHVRLRTVRINLA